MRRYRIAIAGGATTGCSLRSHEDPGARLDLRHRADGRSARRAASGRRSPHETSPSPKRTLRELDARLTEAHDSRSPRAYVVFGLGAPLRAARAPPALAVLGTCRDPRRPRRAGGCARAQRARGHRAAHRGLALLGVVGWGAVALAAVTRARLAFAAALLAIFPVYLLVLAISQETSSLAAFGPHPDGGVRFYGISNQVETLLLVPGLLGAALLGPALVPARRRARARRRRREPAGSGRRWRPRLRSRLSSSCGCGCGRWR